MYPILVHFLLFFLVSNVASKVLPISIIDPELVRGSLPRRQASFVGVLSNLPTIAPASYCTEVLEDGRHIAHTKTGASCTYNTMGPSQPTHEPAAQPTLVPSAQPIPGNFGGDRDRSGNLITECHIYQKLVIDINGNKHWKPVDRDLGANECRQVCKAQVSNTGTTMPNTACMRFGDHEWNDFGPVGLGTQIAAGKCLCNDPALAKIAEEFVTKALPAVGEVTCKVWYTAIHAVVMGGLEAIPGAGTALAATFSLAYQAAQVAAYTFDTEEGAADGLRTWLESPAGAAANSSTWAMDNVCGNKYTPEEGQNVFGVFGAISGAIPVTSLFPKALKAFPPPWAAGKGSVEDMLGFMGDLGAGRKKPKGDKPEVTKPQDTKPRPTDKSSANPSSAPSSPTSRATSDSSASACTKNGKRAPGNGKNDECDKPTVTIVKASATAKNHYVETKTCDFKLHTQACGHYYSVIKDGGKNRFTCEDSNTRVDGQYTRDWYKQHNTAKGWKDFVSEKYTFKADSNQAVERDPKCHADEWPPAYFMPAGRETEKEWGQRIRWLPGSENTGAAQVWTSFCANHDGGENNGQRTVPRRINPDDDKEWAESDEEYHKHPLNPKLVEGVKGMKPDSVDKSGKTVTETYNKITYTRAVFELDFKNPRQDGYPSEANNWYLNENPCWPEDIVPNDPGFVLLTDDPWYTVHHQDLLKDVGMYAEAPSAKLIDAAKARRGKRPASDDGSQPPKAQKPNDPPSGGSQRLRRGERLELIRNRVVLRDDVLNTTRPLTNEEISQHVEITDCADRFCLIERKKHGNDDSVYIPGAAPRPSANIAVPTLVTRIVPEAPVRRTPLSVDIPVITAAAILEES